ncbi:MAG: 50S ribosomal protein L2 [archaeon]
MGKNLTQQKRGKGSPTFKAPSFRWKGAAKVPEQGKGIIIDLINSQPHSAPIAIVKYEEGDYGMQIAPQGVRVGEELEIAEKTALKTGNTMQMRYIPEGTAIYNLEGKPGDGGKFARASGQSARIVTKSGNSVVVILPSKKKKEFNPDCKASIGIVAGAGRRDKPFLKAGNKVRAMKAKNKYYPKVSGVCMNAVAHPFGGGRSSRTGRPTIAPKNAPPGRKVGMIRPRRTGRKKR